MAAPPQLPYQIKIVGAARTPLRDAYHAFLRIPWWQALGLIVATYLLLNAIFACLYLIVGGVAEARPGSFTDAYVFSVQTMATIGYGVMHPVSGAAHAVVIAESVTSLLMTAVATGLVFAKFALARGRVRFATRITISPYNGVPTLCLRLGNERGNQLIEATIHLDMMRTERTSEGHTFYRTYELQLARSRSPQFNRSFTLLHTINDESPFYGKTPDAVIAEETELLVTVLGLDDTTGQTVHAQHRYMATDIHWGARYVDILSETPDGNMLLDLRRFNDTEPTKPTESFPYPAS
jgi:inward rectifier potassium channel